MRARTILLILAILAIAGFAMLNWAEFVRPVPLSFGAFITDAPLGLLMLSLLVIVLLGFVLMSALMRTQSLVETHHHHKALDHQRELADKAEASRFTELRQHMDLRLREIENRLDIHLRNLSRSDVLRDPVRDPLRDPIRDPLRRDPLAEDVPVRADPNRPEWVGRERV